MQSERRIAKGSDEAGGKMPNWRMSGVRLPRRCLYRTAATHDQSSRCRCRYRKVHGYMLCTLIAHMAVAIVPATVWSSCDRLAGCSAVQKEAVALGVCVFVSVPQRDSGRDIPNSRSWRAMAGRFSGVLRSRAATHTVVMMPSKSLQSLKVVRYRQLTHPLGCDCKLVRTSN